MPELPEVEQTRRSLEPHLLGRTIAAAELLRRDMLILPNDPAGGNARHRRTGRAARAAPEHLLESATISQMRRRGKQLAIVAADGRVLVVQLGMSGQFFVLPRGEAPTATHIHARWAIAGRSRNPAPHRILVFRDPRRFGGLRFFPTTAALDAHWESLGPDALSISASDLAGALSRASRPTKAALLDQGLIAGVGNIYADEALFRSGIHPLARASRLRAPRIDALAEAIRAVLAQAVALGGSTLRDYRDGSMSPGTAQTALEVYSRSGQPCTRCRRALRSMTVAQRTTTFCPTCQVR
ncbi:MAG: bifunctional DNA-formamidopyrimidine glycosylase/DNA-(apurinic or apyrimidinic site) lyase [Phycisphaeraceae bacterium]|nr:bifunctional DNA-formamidopyrimidine glycosylase/DNA-(apurinic or apyrimidinic site) lyase [Phycisphaeraceae bacterium]